ncbi:MAG: CHC2 zinc finger domain-containing protein [Chloroflexia bacterium]
MSFQNGRTIIEEVKSRLDIVDLVGSQVELRRAGKDFKGRCPFHEEKTPSFVVSPERQSYHCYGCGKSGDVISYLMETERLPFVDALKQLAERAGVTYETPAHRTPKKQTARTGCSSSTGSLLATSTTCS